MIQKWQRKNHKSHKHTLVYTDKVSREETMLIRYVAQTDRHLIILSDSDPTMTNDLKDLSEPNLDFFSEQRDEINGKYKEV